MGAPTHHQLRLGWPQSLEAEQVEELESKPARAATVDDEAPGQLRVPLDAGQPVQVALEAEPPQRGRHRQPERTPAPNDEELSEISDIEVAPSLVDCGFSKKMVPWAQSGTALCC